MEFLYATDGSEGAQRGAHFLAGLRLESDSHIRILTVVPHQEEESAGTAALDAACEILQSSGARLTRHTTRGSSSGEVLQAILEESAVMIAESGQTPAGSASPIIVVGTQGRSAISQFFLGSVAERLTHYAQCPVLLARPLHGTFDRVIVGVDGSGYAQRAALALVQFPFPERGEIRLLSVVTPEKAVASKAFAGSLGGQLRSLALQERSEAEQHLKELTDLLESERPVKAAPEIFITTEIRADDPASGILEACTENRTDLLVVGSKGVSGIERFLIGSVSEKVLRYAQCSVLVVRQPKG